MKIKFLGTAAAEGMPAVFCDCENCRKARELGGRNYRTRSQAMIDSNLLLDFPCDTYYHISQNNIDLLDIKHILITHTHEDHLYPTEFNYLKDGFSHPPEDWHGITVYGNEYAGKALEYAVKNSREKLLFEKLVPFNPVKIGEYTVTALKAVHGAPDSYIYIIEKKGKCLLYAHDTGFLSDETWEYIKNSGIRFDLVSLDCNEGAMETLNYSGHMCLGITRKCRERLYKINAIDDNTTVVLNHFSHNGLKSAYDDFCIIAEKENFLVSYDGMECEI